MDRIMKQTILRLLILFAGLVVAHLGVSLFLLADLGSDPFNVMIQGLSRMMDIGFMTHGNTHMAISILIIILLFVDKSYIKIGTLICMFCGGPIIDLFSLLLGNLITPESHMALRIVCNALGCVILACGMSVVIKSEAGTGPLHIGFDDPDAFKGTEQEILPEFRRVRDEIVERFTAFRNES